MSKTPLLAAVPERGRRALWIGLLTASSLLLSLIFACATPFAAFAALAALNMKRTDAFLLTLIVWLANQAVGYGVLHYPQTFDSFAWGAAIGIAALLATAAAVATERYLSWSGAVVTMAIAFAAAFAVYELALYATAFVLPSSDSAFLWPVVRDILKVNLLALIGLGLLSSAASAVGLTPRPGAIAVPPR